MTRLHGGNPRHVAKNQLEVKCLSVMSTILLVGGSEHHRIKSGQEAQDSGEHNIIGRTFHA